MLAGFSGYLAADEVYDGPFCVLFIVDNRTFRRLAYRVLDTNPTKEDVLAFFTDFQGVLHAQGLCVAGVTTAGSPLYPEAIATAFPGAKHQVCEFHVLKEILNAVLQALAKGRNCARCARSSRRSTVFSTGAAAHTRRCRSWPGSAARPGASSSSGARCGSSGAPTSTKR